MSGDVEYPPPETLYRQQRDYWRQRAEKADEALISIWTYLRLDDRLPDHSKFGEACGEDTCIVCLAEATAKEALRGAPVPTTYPSGGEDS
jgi:hypothetical protein